MANQNLFNSIEMTKPKRNVFDLSHDYKTAIGMGNLIPMLLLDLVPGDKVSLQCQGLFRLQALIAPVMHRVDVYMHFFFVANRLVWPGWEDFIVNGGLSEDVPAHPIITYGEDELPFGDLMDYMGLPDPAQGSGFEPVSAIPLAAYQAIYNEYYRDENLVAEVDYTLVDGDNNANGALRILRKRAWQHDYFTAALPFAQKGQPVTIPITGFSDVEVMRDITTTGFADVITADQNGAPTFIDVSRLPTADIPSSGRLYAQTSALETQEATINDLRTAFKLQEWLEKNARGGTRYIENILAHFGVRSSDKRLQRPEYITGTKSPIVISEVLNTTGTEDLPQGNMAGHGISVTGGKYGTYFAEEHGYVVGIMSILPKPAYQQGIDRHWSRFRPTDYFWPSFANIGEQEVLKREIFAFQGAASAETFGYSPRYAEYKYIPSKSTAEMRTNLSFWTLTRIFATPPLLNQTFIECSPADADRIFAVSGLNNNSIICHVYHKIKAVRPMPKFGSPHM